MAKKWRGNGWVKGLGIMLALIGAGSVQYARGTGEIRQGPQLGVSIALVLVGVVTYFVGRRMR